MNFKKSFKDLALLSVFVLAIQVLLSKVVYPMIPGVGVTQNVFSITPQTALMSATIGDKIIGVLTGIVPFNLGDLMMWLSLFLGVFVLLFAGLFVYEKVPRGLQGKNIYWRLGLILLYGTGLLYLVLLVTKMSSVATIGIPLLIGLLINYAIVTVVVVLVASTKLGRKFVRI